MMQSFLRASKRMRDGTIDAHGKITIAPLMEIDRKRRQALRAVPASRFSG